MGNDSPAALGYFLPSCTSTEVDNSRRLLSLGGHVDHKAHHPVTIAKFIITPGNEINKVLIEGNASSSIKGERVSISVKVTGKSLALTVAKDAIWTSLP